METVDLVRAITLERRENTVEFRQVALRVLEGRGAVLSEYVDSVSVRRNDGEEQPVAIQEALAGLQSDLDPWDALIFTSCLGDVLGLQRQTHGWVAHYYGGDRYGGSFLLQGPEQARKVLSLFLELQEWTRLAGEAHHLDSWEALVDSDSRELIQTVCADLDVEGIPYIVQVPRFAPQEGETLTILVPPDQLDSAYDIIDEAEETVEDFYVLAEELAESGDLTRELEVYDNLAQTDPENPAVHYNRGSVLLELSRWEESADALVEAVGIGLKSAESDLELNPTKGSRGMGGMMGVFALLFRKATAATREDSPAAARPRYPDYIDDAHIFLERLLGKLPGSKKILHCLASIARLRNDTAAAEMRYRRILELDPEDQVAYFNLGYLHSEKGSATGSDT